MPTVASKIVGKKRPLVNETGASRDQRPCVEAPKVPLESDRKHLKTSLPLLHVSHVKANVSVAGKRSNVQLELERWPISSITPQWKQFSDNVSQKWHKEAAAAAVARKNEVKVEPLGAAAAAAAAENGKKDRKKNNDKKKKSVTAMMVNQAISSPSVHIGGSATETNVLLKPFRVHHKLLSQVSRMEWQIYEREPVRCVLYQGTGNEERIVAIIRA